VDSKQQDSDYSDVTDADEEGLPSDLGNVGWGRQAKDSSGGGHE
jgi:hypothetical protein